MNYTKTPHRQKIYLLFDNNTKISYHLKYVSRIRVTWRAWIQYFTCNGTLPGKHFLGWFSFPRTWLQGNSSKKKTPIQKKKTGYKAILLKTYKLKHE